jgi:lipoate-protein ligase A
VETPAVPNEWFVLDSGPGNAAYNMALDEALLEAMPRLGRPVLRFYGWTEPAASFGYFQKWLEVEELTRLRPLVRRPTAGGLVPHDADWTYSLAFPVSAPWYSLTAQESYRRVHESLQSAFARLGAPTELAPTSLKLGPGQCFAGYECADLLWRGRKIAGAAQRRRKDGLLIQGSIQPPPLPLERRAWQQAWCEAMQLSEGAGWTELTPDNHLSSRADRLSFEKYSQPSYNQKR